ncbi:MAG TPA: FHA domain-containing protein [Actinomycetes bacterium]|jgi:FHA domain
MSELTLTVIRLGFLAVLWLFVLTAISVMRSDIFGARTGRRPAPRKTAQTRRPTPSGPAGRGPRPAKPAKPKRGTPAKLIVTAGSLSGTSVPLSDAPITIGRAADSTIVLDDDYASSHHARVYPHDGMWLVEDLGSTNGTYLDRRKVDGPTPVQIGIPIRIGKTVLELRK